MARVRLRLATCVLASGIGVSFFSEFNAYPEWRAAVRQRCVPACGENLLASLAHRSPRAKAAAPIRNQNSGPRNPKIALNNLVGKTLRREMLSGDILYDVDAGPEGFQARVRVVALEADGKQLEFAGAGKDELAAEMAAAAAAVAALPAPPEFEPRYPKPRIAAAQLKEQLYVAGNHQGVELDSPMAAVLPTLAYLPVSLGATAQYILDDEYPCRIQVRSGDVPVALPPEEIRSIFVSGRTIAGKLAASMRARLLGEDGGRIYQRLELKMAGKSAFREAAIATKILQRFLPDDVQVRFMSRFEKFEGYQAQGLVETVMRTMV